MPLSATRWSRARESGCSRDTRNIWRSHQPRPHRLLHMLLIVFFACSIFACILLQNSGATTCSLLFPVASNRTTSSSSGTLFQLAGLINVDSRRPTGAGVRTHIPRRRESRRKNDWLRGSGRCSFFGLFLASSRRRLHGAQQRRVSDSDEDVRNLLAAGGSRLHHLGWLRRGDKHPAHTHRPSAHQNST